MPIPKPLPSRDVLLRLFLYEPETGRLYRRALEPSDFQHADLLDRRHLANHYNATQAGKEAFTSADKKGYRHGKIFGVNYQAHRVIWKMVNGIDPDTIDHINGSPSDNRLANLRDASVAENSRNYRKPTGTSSEYRGVTWVKRDKRWAARISAGGKRNLGYFTDEIAAARAYDDAARELHGAFAVLNFPEG